jgi:xanthine dehydrogenase accessory factor
LCSSSRTTPKFDEPALLAALRTNAGYIGALGSRQTTTDRERRLRRAGATDDDIARIHAPCGLDIGSRTAEETAVSVLAEIIASRANRGAAPLRRTTGPIHDREYAVGDRSLQAAAPTLWRG